jgi:hypothetical protein
MPDEPIEMAAEPFDMTPRPAHAEDEPSPRRSRARTIVLGSLLALGLAGAAAIGTTGWRIAQQKDARLEMPERVAGLNRDDSERALSAADYLRTALAAEVRLDETVGAVYADPAAADRSVLLFAGRTLLWTPESDLDSVFGLIADDAGAVTGLRKVPAGDLGGVMKCGTTTSPDGDIAVCGWADHGSLGIAMFPGRGAGESGPLLRQIRSKVQTRE